MDANTYRGMSRYGTFGILNNPNVVASGVASEVPPQYESNYCISQSVRAVNSVTGGNTTPSPN
jgi:hypothetical protein